MVLYFYPFFSLTVKGCERCHVKKVNKILKLYEEIFKWNSWRLGIGVTTTQQAYIGHTRTLASKILLIIHRCARIYLRLPQSCFQDEYWFHRDIFSMISTCQLVQCPLSSMINGSTLRRYWRNNCARGEVWNSCFLRGGGPSLRVYELKI